MKYQAPLIILFFIFHGMIFSQSCLPEGITFTSQEQIDSFQVNYPGCSIIEGDVMIRGADISDLDGLNGLDSVLGCFTIGDSWKGVNPELITLEGMENLAFIGEDLVIHNNDNLVSIQALSGLNRIGKSLRILDNDHLMSLTGLEGIDSLSEMIDFQNNNALTNLTGLDNLKYVKRGIFLFTNEGLIDLEGLGNLTFSGNVDISNHSSLTSLSGLDNLSTVGSLVIYLNDALTSLTGLESLDSISDGMTIEGNAILSSLDGLTNLESLVGGLIISNNDALLSLSGIEGITSIGGNLFIEWNNSLSSLQGLQNVSAASIEGLWVDNNQNLSDCAIQNICDYIANPEGSINIFNNSSGCDNPHEIADVCGFPLSCLPFGNYYFLTQADIDSFPIYYSNCNALSGFVKINGENIYNLDSLSGIDSIMGSLFICGNSNLSSLNGLINLTEIQGDLNIGYWECGGNPGLTNMMGLNNLASVGDGMLILGNAGLLSLTGLDNLTTIGEWLQVSYNKHLANLEGIGNLNSVGSLDVSGNDSLLILDGLQSLINIGGNISIGYNPLLTTLTGLENFNTDLISSLWITNNESLTECNIQSICDYLNNPDVYTTIHDNAPGCNSPEEVEAACGVSISESAVGGRQSAVVYYPNPATDMVTFDIHLQASGDVKLMVFNNMGQLVATITDGELEKGDHQILWNSAGLPPGIYFYLLTTGNHRYSGKIVKL